jgi:hypothetical protein
MHIGIPAVNQDKTKIGKVGTMEEIRFQKNGQPSGKAVWSGHGI